MAIVAADLQTWLSVATPVNDVDVSGGIIQDDAHASGGVLGEFTDIAGTDIIQVLSDGADTRNIVVTGRKADGSLASETLTLNGVTPVPTANQYERFMSAVLASKSASRIVTVRRSTGSTLIATLGVNVLAVRRMFFSSNSEAAEANRYELCYKKNKHGTLALNSAVVKLTADPASKMTIGVAAAKGDVSSVANRKTAPAGITFYDDGVAINVPTNVLAAGERIGVWTKQTLAASALPVKNTFTIELSGSTIA